MIILDTNALPVRGELRNPIMSALLKAAEANGVPVCLPAVVVDESVNMRLTAALEAETRLREALTAAAKLFDLEPVYVPDPAQVASEWRANLESTFEVLPLKGANAAEALRREALRLPPAREGRGGRDVAIWLTALQGPELHGSQPVYLVTNNLKDFCDKSSALMPELVEEARSADAEIVLCRTLDEALSHVSTPFTFAESSIDQEVLRDRLPDLLNELDPGEGESPLRGSYILRVDEIYEVNARRAIAAGDSWLVLLNARTVAYGVEDETGYEFSLAIWARLWVQLQSAEGPIGELSLERVSRAS